jgi:hypothetical protein
MANILQIPQTLTGVPPGNYTVRVTARTNTGAEMIGTSSVSVNGVDVNVEIPMHPVATVSGKLVFQDSAKRPSGTVVVGLSREGASYSASVHADGSFQFPNISPGKYQAVVRSPSGYFLTGNVAVEVGDGDSVSASFTASDATGAVRGFVKSGDQDAPGVLAVLASVSETPQFHGFQTESDGSFNFTNIPAGKYLLFAVEDTAFEYLNPEAVKPYLANAKPVTIEAHKASVQDVGLTALKP